MVKRQQNKGEGIPIAEWIAAGLGALIVITALAILGAAAIRNDDTPPLIVITRDSTVAVGRSHLVNLEVVNQGDRTAAEVPIEGILTDQAGRVVERSQAILDFLPSKSPRRLGLIFANDPRSHVLTIRALGYIDP